MSQLSFCCCLCQTKGVLGMWKINLGQDTTMLDPLQTNKQRKAICWKEDPGVSMPLGPSHLPHFRQKLTLLYFPCQENTSKSFPLVRLQLKMALLAASSKSVQAAQQSPDLPSSWTIPAPWSAGLLIHPNYGFSLCLWVNLPKLSNMA